MRYTIDGVYDQRTFNLLKTLKIDSFSFDFRPTSFNFFQQYRFLDLVEKCFDSKDRYFLHFCGEADFVIQKMVDDLREKVSDEELQCFMLEFSDRCSPKFYDQFEFPYILHYSPELKPENFSNSKFLNGIVLHFSHLEEMHREGRLFSFIQSFFQLVKTIDIELILKADWDADIFPSLVELLDFDSVALPVNDKVEVCYRNVDLNKLSNLLTVMKSNFRV